MKQTNEWTLFMMKHKNRSKINLNVNCPIIELNATMYVWF